ncbi:MAG: VWA domain-containing protein, partial [Clostridia bacterium]|nr:VWA domain-containing protein [Clostridia bacterium]
MNDPSSISTVTFNNDLNAGLTAAKNVLDTKGSGNKKIIVVFTDADKAEAETAKATSNTLEESGVSIYTVGISVTDDAAQVLEKLSTEYYGSSDVKKLNSDHNTYAYTSNEVPDLNKAVSEIAESIKHPTIQATLNENWVLQDIISDNFDLITKKVHVDFATVNGGVQGGTIKWDNEPQKIDPEKNDSVTYDEALLKEDKILRVTGFDFGAHRIEEGQPNGQKLVVTIYGLRRADFVTQEDGKVYSNEANSGLYQSEADTNNDAAPFAEFPKPFLEFKPEWNTVTDDASLTATEVRISKHLKVIAGTVLDDTSTVDFKVQLRSIEDEYYVAGDENHNFAKHDEDHTEAGRLSAEDIEELTVECDLQTVGKTPKAGSSPGQYSQSGATNGIQTYVFNTQNILDEIIFPHAGWYVFDISEDTGSFVVNNDTLETAETKPQIKMVADADTHYTMKVYVENQGTDNQLVVTNATVRRGGPYTLTYNDDGTVKTRTLGAPGAEDADSTDAKVYLSKDRDQNGVTFQNEYLVPEDGQELEISKVVDVETEDSTDDNFQTRALNVSEDHMDPDDDETALIADQSFHFNAVISIPEELTDLTGGFIALDSSRIELSKTDGTTSSQITVGTVTTLSDINGSEDQAVLQLRPGETAKGEVLV